MVQELDNTAIESIIDRPLVDRDLIPVLPPFEYKVLDVSVPEHFIEHTRLFRLDDKDFYEDPRLLTDWMQTRDDNALYIQLYESSGLTEWAIGDYLTSQGCYTSKIAMLREPTLLISGMCMILQFTFNTEAIAAAQALWRLKLNQRCFNSFNIFRYEGGIVFPVCYDYRLIQYAIQAQDIQSCEIQGINFEYRWFVAPNWDPMLKYTPVPGYCLGDFIEFEKDVFYKYNFNTKRFQQFKPQGQQIKLKSLGATAQNFYHRQVMSQGYYSKCLGVVPYSSIMSKETLPACVRTDIFSSIPNQNEKRQYFNYGILNDLTNRIVQRKIHAQLLTNNRQSQE